MIHHYFAKWNFSVQQWNLNAIYFSYVFPTHTFVPNDDFDKWNLVIKFILANVILVKLILQKILIKYSTSSLRY